MAHHDVLLIESRPGIAEHTARDLAAAGHTVHRCHEPDMPAFPCKALTQPGSCPLDGNIDVALLVRQRVLPRPTQVEDGVSCAIRAGIPLVEQGTGTLDPFDPWVTRRIERDDEVEAALSEAIDMANGPLRRDITNRIRPLLERALLSADETTISIRHHDGETEVELLRSGEVDERLDHALAVRVLDAARSDKRKKANQTRVYVHHR